MVGFTRQEPALKLTAHYQAQVATSYDYSDWRVALGSTGWRCVAARGGAIEAGALTSARPTGQDGTTTW